MNSPNLVPADIPQIDTVIIPNSSSNPQLYADLLLTDAQERKYFAFVIVVGAQNITMSYVSYQGVETNSALPFTASQPASFIKRGVKALRFRALTDGATVTVQYEPLTLDFPDSLPLPLVDEPDQVVSAATAATVDRRANTPAR